MENTVYIVHCIDTEGPLYESIEATFERVNRIFDLDLEPSVASLRKLQAGEVDLDGLEEAVRKVVDPHLLAYNDTWDKVDAMLERAMSRGFREELLDSRGGGWIYNWFCVDHVDYDVNPRRRDIGYHNVFDHYRHILREFESPQDGLHFHFHPHPFRKEAHHNAAHWWQSSNALHQILSRRVIDRRWFPAAHRPGFHVIRPESHWFLEQYIPFDFSNQAMETTPEDESQFGLATGRFGDWRRAPASWVPYHPSHDDYQTPGDCRRWIARCLNIGTRYGLLEEGHIRQAFEEARQGKSVVLSFTNHDFRDLTQDVQQVRDLLRAVTVDYPDIQFQFAEAVEAMRSALQLPPEPPCELDMDLQRIGEDSHLLTLTSTTPVFGPQPWLAIKDLAGGYHHDNFAIDRPHRAWRYVFDSETFPLRALESIGIAANNSIGTTAVATLDIARGKTVQRLWNEPQPQAKEAAALGA